MSKKCIKNNCKAWALVGDDYCFSHSPQMAEKRQQARQKGGIVGKNPHDRIKINLEPIVIEHGSDIKKMLVETINLVRIGQMDIKVANCIGNLSNILVKVIEITEIEEKVEQIEEKILKKNE